MVTTSVIGEYNTSLEFKVTFDPRDFRESSSQPGQMRISNHLHPVLRLMPVVAVWNNVCLDCAASINFEHMPLRFHEAKLGRFEVVLNRSVIW